MKLGGKKIEGVNIVTIPIPRGTNPEDAIIFKAQAVLDMDGFEKLCPIPMPPVSKKPGGKKVQNVESPAYKAEVALYAARRTHYIVLKSLEATPDLEWETVKIEDASTWGNFQQELLEAGFCEQELIRIYQGVMTANGMNNELIEEARKSFLARQEEAELVSTSQTGEHQNTASSEPAND